MGRRIGLVQVVRFQPLVEQVYVAETEGAVFPYRIGPIVTTVVPDAAAAGFLAVAESDHAGRRRRFETLPEPPARLGQRLYGQLAGS